MRLRNVVQHGGEEQAEDLKRRQCGLKHQEVRVVSDIERVLWQDPLRLLLQPPLPIFQRRHPRPPPSFPSFSIVNLAIVQNPLLTCCHRRHQQDPRHRRRHRHRTTAR